MWNVLTWISKQNKKTFFYGRLTFPKGRIRIGAIERVFQELRQQVEMVFIDEKEKVDGVSWKKDADRCKARERRAFLKMENAN
jgi:ssDNA-binding Zn-finger/Zn-ribbon topoisomerase 1